MARVVLRILIHAPPEAIWPLISDLTGQERWMEDVRSLSVRGAGRSATGPSSTSPGDLSAARIHDVMEITTLGSAAGTRRAPPRPVHGHGLSGSRRRSGHRVHVARGISNSPLGPIGELIFSLVVGPHLRRVWRRSMENVRRIVERSPMS